VAAAVIAAALVAALAAFFQYTSTGRALRAVADDHQAAQSIGIPLKRIWVIVWSVAGFVALVAGIIWGSKLGVQFSLSLVALKALPVVILGGLTSVPGAIIGGLIIGVGEKLSEVFIGPISAAASRSGLPMCWRWCSCWCGRKACSARRSSIASDCCHQRRSTCSTEKTASSRPCYRGRPADLPDQQQDRRSHRHGAAAGRGLRGGAAAGQRVPVPRHPHPVPDPVAGGAGAEHPGRLLRADQPGHGRLHGGGRLRGLQLPGAHRRHAGDVSMLLGGVCATAVGVVFGIPSLRIKGLYLAVATLAAQFFVDWAFLRIKWFTNDSSSGSVSVAGLSVLGWKIETPVAKYLFCLGFLVGVRAAGQEPGAQPHRARMDGHPRHGRGRVGDRHPPGVRQAHGLCRQPSSSAWPARCGALSTWARGSRRPLASTAQLRPAVHGHHRRAGLDHGQLLRRRLHRAAADLAGPVAAALGSLVGLPFDTAWPRMWCS
jgi:ABC-type branched-subunit amino acid transport system permease subunit